MLSRSLPKRAILVILTLILLIITGTNLYRLHAVNGIANKNENNLRNQINGIVNNFIENVRHRTTTSSSCNDIDSFTSIGTGQNENDNGSSYITSSISSGSSKSLVSSGGSGVVGNMVSNGPGDDHSNNIVSVLGGSDDHMNDNVICGGPGNDILVGELGNNIIYGGAGYDKLLGGPENDILIGGPGADYFDCGLGNDTIRDYHPSEGDTKTDDCENY